MWMRARRWTFSWHTQPFEAVVLSDSPTLRNSSAAFALATLVQLRKTVIACILKDMDRKSRWLLNEGPATSATTVPAPPARSTQPSHRIVSSKGSGPCGGDLHIRSPQTPCSVARMISPGFQLAGENIRLSAPQWTRSSGGVLGSCQITLLFTHGFSMPHFRSVRASDQQFENQMLTTRIDIQVRAKLTASHIPVHNLSNVVVVDTDGHDPSIVARYD